MGSLIVGGVAAGVLLAILDVATQANPLARNLLQFYAPVARTSVNAGAGIAIDVAFGFGLAAIFLLLRESLPGNTGLVKGLSFAAGLWFLRVVMHVASEWMMLKMPLRSAGYLLLTGLVEMTAIGAAVGLIVRPSV